MKKTLQLPIEYDKERVGFFYSGPVSEMPGAMAKEVEVLGMALAQKVISKFQGGTCRLPLDVAFQSLMRHVDTMEIGGGL